MKNKRNIFKNELEYYSILIEGIKAHMPDYFMAYSKKIDKQIKRFDVITNKIKEKDGKKYINKKHFLEYRKLNIESRQSHNTIPMISKSQYVMLFIIFENFLRKMIKLSLDKNKDILKLKEKNINLCDLLEFSTIQEIIDYSIEIEVNNALHNKKNIFEWLRSIFGIEITNLNKMHDKFINYNKIRNLLVHNNGIVNDIYIKSIKDLNLDKKIILKKGQEIKIEPDLFIDTARNLYLIGLQLGINLWLKSKPNDIKIIENYIIEEQVKFLEKRMFNVVEYISNIAISTIKNYSDKDNEYIILINKATASKFLYKNELYKTIIKNIKINKNNKIINLAIALLNSDFKLASTYAEKLNKKTIKIYFVLWPLFYLNRDQKLLKRNFKNIIGDFNSVELN